MPGTDDALDELIGLTSQRGKRRQPGTETQPTAAESRGLNPLDLLNLPSNQREVVNWLSRKKEARLSEIIEALSKTDAASVRAAVTELKDLGYLHEALIDGEIYYRVVFRGTVMRAGRGLPQTLWTLIDLDNVTFLKQVYLFNGLSEDQLKEVSSKLETRQYHRNEVILWQGAQNERVYFVKNGMVGVSRIYPGAQAPQMLAYIKQGEMFGEFSILAEQGHVATANVTALSEVTVLVMNYRDCLELLKKYSSTGIALAQVLIKRLQDTNARLGSRAVETKLTLVFGVKPGVGCTTVGSTLAMTLAAVTQKPAVYTEYPLAANLPALFSYPADAEIHNHPGGYDVVVPLGAPDMPPSVRTTLVMDQLVNKYPNIVVGITGPANDTLAYMIERASQVIIVTPPDAESWAQLNQVSASLKPYIRPEKTSLFVVVNRSAEAYSSQPAAGHADFDIPFVGVMPSLAEQRADNLPEPLAKVAGVVADRLGRTNQIGVYIPSTIGVDQRMDTSAYIEKTLAFLGQLFGGATSSQAQGVWNSNDAGLVSESVYVIRSFVTQSDLDKRLPEVLEYVEQLKVEMKQEAMALEVNQKLMIM
ncbi:MAG: Crp/Fnr family transcriptional regulator [Chloroflexota bacterium]